MVNRRFSSRNAANISRRPARSRFRLSLLSARTERQDSLMLATLQMLQHSSASGLFKVHRVKKRKKRPKISLDGERNCTLLLEIQKKKKREILNLECCFPSSGCSSAEDEEGQPGRLEEHPRAASLGGFPGIPGAAAAESTAGDAELREWAEPLAPERTQTQPGVRPRGLAASGFRGLDAPPPSATCWRQILLSTT